MNMETRRRRSVEPSPQKVWKKTKNQQESDDDPNESAPQAGNNANTDVFECIQCGLVSFNEEEVKTHVTKKHLTNVKVLPSQTVCPYCQYEAGTRKKFRDHLDDCTAKRIQELLINKRKPDENPIQKIPLSDKTCMVYECKVCQFEHVSEKAMRRHVTIRHVLDIPVFSCPSCSVNVADRGLFDLHASIAHEQGEAELNFDPSAFKLLSKFIDSSIGEKMVSKKVFILPDTCKNPTVSLVELAEIVEKLENVSPEIPQKGKCSKKKGGLNSFNLEIKQLVRKMNAREGRRKSDPVDNIDDRVKSLFETFFMSFEKGENICNDNKNMASDDDRKDENNHSNMRNEDKGEEISVSKRNNNGDEVKALNNDAPRRGRRSLKTFDGEVEEESKDGKDKQSKAEPVINRSGDKYLTSDEKKKDVTEVPFKDDKKVLNGDGDHATERQGEEELVSTPGETELEEDVDMDNEDTPSRRYNLREKKMSFSELASELQESEKDLKKQMADDPEWSDTQHPQTLSKVVVKGKPTDKKLTSAKVILKRLSSDDIAKISKRIKVSVAGKIAPPQNPVVIAKPGVQIVNKIPSVSPLISQIVRPHSYVFMNGHLIPIVSPIGSQPLVFPQATTTATNPLQMTHLRPPIINPQLTSPVTVLGNNQLQPNFLLNRSLATAVSSGINVIQASSKPLQSMPNVIRIPIQNILSQQNTLGGVPQSSAPMVVRPLLTQTSTASMQQHVGSVQSTGQRIQIGNQIFQLSSPAAQTSAFNSSAILQTLNQTSGLSLQGRQLSTGSPMQPVQNPPVQASGNTVPVRLEKDDRGVYSIWRPPSTTVVRPATTVPGQPTTSMQPGATKVIHVMKKPDFTSSVTQQCKTPGGTSDVRANLSLATSSQSRPQKFHIIVYICAECSVMKQGKQEIVYHIVDNHFPTGMDKASRRRSVMASKNSHFHTHCITIYKHNKEWDIPLYRCGHCHLFHIVGEFVRKHIQDDHINVPGLMKSMRSSLRNPSDILLVGPYVSSRNPTANLEMLGKYQKEQPSWSLKIIFNQKTLVANDKEIPFDAMDSINFNLLYQGQETPSTVYKMPTPTRYTIVTAAPTPSSHTVVKIAPRVNALQLASSGSTSVKGPKRASVHVCNKCYFNSSTYDDVKEHVIQNHLDGRLFTCQICKYGDSDRNIMIAHMRITHPQSPVNYNSADVHTFIMSLFGEGEGQPKTEEKMEVDQVEPDSSCDVEGEDVEVEETGSEDVEPEEIEPGGISAPNILSCFPDDDEGGIPQSSFLAYGCDPSSQGAYDESVADSSENTTGEAFACKLCAYSCDTLFKIKSHLMTSHISEEMYPFKCMSCKKETASILRLAQHIMYKHQKHLKRNPPKLAKEMQNDKELWPKIVPDQGKYERFQQEMDCLLRNCVEKE